MDDDCGDACGEPDDDDCGDACGEPDVGGLTRHDLADRHLWHRTWVETEGERTIARHAAASSAPESSSCTTTIFATWFCPFAQRAWIALEELNIDYRWVEPQLYAFDEEKMGGYTKRALPLKRKQRLTPGFVETSPRGLVPSLRVCTRGEEGGGGGGGGGSLVEETVWDSLIVIEYLEDAFEQLDHKLFWPATAKSLFPSGALRKARARWWASQVTDLIQKPFYQMLMSGETADEPCNAERKANFLAAIREFAAEMHPEGAFFFGTEFGFVDIALAPFWQRFLWLGEAYLALTIPDEAPYDRMHSWWKAVSVRPSVAATLVCRPRLVSSYAGYFDGSATSAYAKSIQTK